MGPLDVGPCFELFAARRREVGEELATIECEGRLELTGWNEAGKFDRVAYKVRGERAGRIVPVERPGADARADVGECSAHGLACGAALLIPPEEIGESFAR